MERITNRTFSIASNCWIELPNVRPKKESTHPSAFFTEEGKKPSITVRAIQGDFLTFESYVFSRTIEGTINVEEAICYLWNVFQYIEADLTEEWKSFRTVIGQRNSRISVQNLLTAVVQQDNPFVMTGSLETRVSHRLFVILFLVCPYHIYSNRQPKHQQLCQEYDGKMMRFIPAECKIRSFQFISDKVSWEGKPDYCKLVGALDMFFNRFQNHPFAEARMGTKTARFRDCAALEYFKYLEELTGEPLSNMSEKIWALGVNQDIERINKSGEERDVPFSYAPYFSSMRLGLRSPYSSNENASFHVLVHTVGSINGKPRSLHAFLPDCYNFQDTILNGYQIGGAASARHVQVVFKPRHCIPKRLEEEVSRKLVAHRNLRQKTVGFRLKQEAEAFLRLHGIAV